MGFNNFLSSSNPGYNVYTVSLYSSYVFVASVYSARVSHNLLVSTLTYRQVCCFFASSVVTAARLNVKSRLSKYWRSSWGCFGSNFGAERSPLLGIGIFAIAAFMTGVGTTGTGADTVD